MHRLLVVAVILALVALATALGFVWRSQQGRVPSATSGRRDRGVPLGERATLLQFSTEVCSPCRATARVLGAVADRTDAVEHSTSTSPTAPNSRLASACSRPRPP